MGNSQGRPVVITDEVKLEHFKLLRVVGKGAFGKVRIVERKDTGLTFALKYIRKDEVIRSENVRNIVRERRMLEHLSHPFLCNLRYSFQDYEYIYLVVDLMSGGDLRFHISRKTFTEDAVRFWIAELGCALRYIHSQGVVHRDVKPDNVLLDSTGHVHLADFNVASEFKPTKQLTSKSGTLAYLAPEVYEGNGYLDEVDWWSLGVVFYECIYNKRPFEGQNHEDLANRIKAASPRYPVTNPLVSTSCSSAMKALIQKNVPDRLGANGFENFKNHPFFLPLDFNELEKLHIPPVFVPSTEKTNFDATYDLEELLLEESPLEARMKHQKPRPALRADATVKEKRQEELHRMIEQYFEPFDYTGAASKEDQICDRVGQTPSDETGRPGIARSKSRRSQNSTTSPTSENPSRPIPHSRTTSHSRSRAPSPTGTDTGSPPLTTQVSIPTIRTQYSIQDLNPTVTSTNEMPLTKQETATTTFATPPPLPRTNTGTSRPALAFRGTHNTRSKSLSIGELQHQRDPSITRPPTSTTTPQTQPPTSTPTSTPPKQKSQRQVLSADSASSIKSAGKEKKGGFLGMLSSKRGRDRSPKRFENGVLGKDGARVVLD